MKKIATYKIGIEFGLIPYSAFQYDIIEEQPTDDPLLGTIQYNYVSERENYISYMVA
ncbi:MAG: hypothetical protein IPL12_21355 [Bacteroidetes bacterium]|nr:hypothetical protein [Bacteroidota bacterium]